MSKYDLLRGWLLNQLGDRAELNFADILDEDRVGVLLPRAAKERREWWANETNPETRHVQCCAWAGAGWEVERVDWVRETVAFRRRG